MSGRRGASLWVCVWAANLVLGVGCVRLLRAGAVGQTWQPAVALLPAVPVALGLLVFLWMLRGMDELRRRLTVSAFALASAVVGIVVYGWSLLTWTGAPPVPSIYVLPAQMLLFSALMLVARLRYP